MPIVTYGTQGYPFLMFPTAAADYLEYERFGIIQAIWRHIGGGKLRVYSINSVNRYSLLNDHASPQAKGEILRCYDRYVTEEVAPFIAHESGGEMKPMTAGASLGAYLAANIYFKHPDLFRGTIALSGSYDVRSYFNSYYDDNLYFNNPVDYLSQLNDHYHLPRLQQADAIFILSGQGRWEEPERSRKLSDILHTRGIPHILDLWGEDVDHDWQWWCKMLDHCINKLF